MKVFVQILACMFILNACGKKVAFKTVHDPIDLKSEDLIADTPDDQANQGSEDQVGDTPDDKANQGNEDQEYQEECDCEDEPDPVIVDEFEIDPIDMDVTPENSTTVRLGIGYEDWADNDYNDSVICFVGQFVFDAESGKIQSLAEQSIDIFVKRNSGSTQSISLSILSSGDAKATPIFAVTDLNRSEERNFPNVNLKKGDHLHIDLGARDGYKASLPHTVNKQRVVIEKDACRTGGG